MHEFLVECQNPTVFDKTIRSLASAALVMNTKRPGEYERQGEHYVMRVFANAGFLSYAIEHQGFGRVIEPLVRE